MMDIFVVILILGSFALALWAAAKRLRAWKEQILHAVSVLESNNALSHEESRRQIHEARASVDAVRQTLEAQVASLRLDVQALSDQNDLRGLVRTHVAAHPGMLERKSAPVRYEEIVTFLKSLDHPNEASRSYLNIHLHRMARTLDITPAPATTRRALELGAYMLMTPAMRCVLGYEEVRGGYLGDLGGHVERTVTSGGRNIFSCQIDLFNVEKDRFPYPGGYFDVVLACEIIEHLVRDPVHMLLECSRVLAPGGFLVLTTPNIASFTSVARVLNGIANPQIYSHYPAADTETPHIREYTPAELRELIACAGLGVDSLFTESINADEAEWTGKLLEYFGLPREFRGEQIYCVARKCVGDASVIRSPTFLYEQLHTGGTGASACQTSATS